MMVRARTKGMIVREKERMKVVRKANEAALTIRNIC
jgi:hypothetical protein